MDIIQHIYCPNCGKPAQRRHYERHRVVETTCPSCDYLLVCSLTGKVLDSYVPCLRMVQR